MKAKTEAQTAPAVPARAKQGAEARDRDWSFVEAKVWTERMVSALENGVKGGKWFSLIDKVFALATLALAYEKVAAKGGAAGVDGQSLERFAARAETYLSELSTALREGTYRPQPVKRVNIPKSDGGLRPLGIPAVKDRIVQAAMKMVIEPIFEAQFLEGSYGFRPGRGCHDALREVDHLIKEGFTYVVDADLADCFGSIPHEPLLRRAEECISDGRILVLLRSWLEADVLNDMERWTPTAGTPQGAVISPLLANIYLHPLDARMAALGHRMVRYADDFVVLCRSREEAETALAQIRQWVEENGLRLHPNKTRLGDCRRPGEGFEFLGYRFEAGRRFVRKKSLNRFKDSIRNRTPRTRGSSLERIVADLNPLLKGWFSYFKHAYQTEFMSLDGFIRRRLRAILRKQNKGPGFGLCQRDSRRWPNTFFAHAGLFALHTAWHEARHPR
ncbi:MAG: group II intron reverse transcriptase/maturase [Acetobacteraceae bacterium]|nr:group II intron reverse transcriptase/maturase [Acetobacteraceae bacterium]